MQHFILSLLLIINLSISLFASNATTQEHLVSLSPIEGADNARPKSLVQVTFDREIIESSVKSHTIQLKPLNPRGKKVSASITISDKATLVFTPDTLLKEGLYRVKINPIKLKADKEDYRASSFVKTKLIQYTFSVVEGPELLSIKLNRTSIELNEGEAAELNAVANYDNNTSIDITQEALWSVSDPSVASIDTNTTLNAIQEGSAQITASLENVTSQTLSLSVRKVINGHTLPPQPDETLNNSTLFGIDNNNNGVRDDVERWIYEEYKDKHPIHIDIAMQAGRAYKQVLETPERAKEIHAEVDKAVYCQLYYRLNAKYFNEPLLLKENAVNEYFRSEIYFNTQERMDAYIQYDTLLSGDSYTLLKFKERKAACDFNTSKYEK